MTQRMFIVFDNTMGLPGFEIDDGLALLYLIGRQNIMKAAGEEPFTIEALCTTHGNSNHNDTFEATTLLCRQLGLSIPIQRGAAANGYRPGEISTSQAAETLVSAARTAESVDELTLLSLGATTDLAIAEQMSPGTLKRFDRTAFMGGITRPLYVGGKQMMELNFSVDHLATLTTFSSVQGETTCIADAHNCLPLTFMANEFLEHLAPEGDESELASFIRATCVPWFEKALHDWNTHGFVGWDVLSAVALAAPEQVQFQPYTFMLDASELEFGRLTNPKNGLDDEADALGGNALNQPTVTVNLITVSQPDKLKAHIYEAWRAALA